MPDAFDDGDDHSLSPATLRGRDWPALRQFCVFLENRVGSLHEVLRNLERNDLRIIALSIVDSIDFAVVRVIVDVPERAADILKLQGIPFMENDVLAVELPDDPQPYMTVVGALVRAEMNIHYTYPLLFRRNVRGAIVLHVDNLELAQQVLREQGQSLLSEGDLLEGGEFF